jgi:4-carboxymuconolactone decarboxylase
VPHVSTTSDFGTIGRFQETPLDQMFPAMKEAFEFAKHLRGLRNNR